MIAKIGPWTMMSIPLMVFMGIVLVVTLLNWIAERNETRRY